MGILAQWIAWKIRIPAILPLILIGLLVGPFSVFVTEDGSKIIDGDRIFQGELLFDFIAISVGLILFEGGLTLKLKELRGLGKTVRNMLIIGTIVSMVGGSLSAYYILGLDIRIAILFGSLIIVTGPTVIGPILRNVKVNSNINTVLKWEGILIDPIGALIAILVYEFIISGRENAQITSFAIKGFLLTISSGLLVGTLLAFSTYYILKRRELPRYLMNAGVLALVVVCFSFSEFIHEESGLLAVTIMGMILANMRLDVLRNILSFKEDISVMLISLLFLLLSSRMDIQDITILGYSSLIIFAIVVFVLRPVTIFLSTINSNLSVNEKLFISWISPRGIVAAGIASIFTVRLTDPDGPVGGIADAQYLLSLTFLIILGTVILQGSTAKMVARALGVLRAEPTGVLFLGANEAARYIARFLQNEGVKVLLADTAKSSTVEARSMGLQVYNGSLLSEGVLDELDLNPYGQFYAMTSNTEINILAMKQMVGEFEKKNMFRLVSKNEMDNISLTRPKELLFNGEVDYISLVTAVRANPVIKKKKLTGEEEYKQFLESNKDRIIPLFVQDKEHNLEPVTKSTEISEGDCLVYLEKHINRRLKPEEEY